MSQDTLYNTAISAVVEENGMTEIKPAAIQSLIATSFLQEAPDIACGYLHFSLKMAPRSVLIDKLCTTGAENLMKFFDPKFSNTEELIIKDFMYECHPTELGRTTCKEFENMLHSKLCEYKISCSGAIDAAHQGYLIKFFEQ